MKMIYIFILLFSKLGCYELAIASQFRDEAFYLREWVEYHRLVGVDHFWLYNNSSVDNWEEILQPYIDSGLVEVIYWPSPPSDFESNHGLALLDAVKRAAGNTKWVAMIDIDEFLVPMKEKSVVECLERHFASASAIYASWRMFGTGGLYLSPGEPILAKLTACSFKYHPMNASGKCIVRPEWANSEKIWTEHYMMLLPGSHGYYNGSGESMNFDGIGFLSVPIHKDRYLRINHYNLRDENFYQNVRLERARKGIYGSYGLYLEHHEHFSMMRDYTIITLLKKHFPEQYETFWNR